MKRRTIFLLIGGAVLTGILLVMNQQTTNPDGSAIPPAPNAVVGAIAQAIATAEGFFTGSGSIPSDQNNPGDITDSSIGGVTATGTGENGISIFGSLEDGWNALYAKIQNILSGGSSVYDPNSSIADIGSTWANGDSNWGNNVAAALGVSPDSSLNDYAAANADTQ
jgi:hypothetical protein